MTPTNHLDELKKLRDETYSPFKRTPAQIAALNHVIKREELLADAEGHARALQYVAHKAHRYFESELYQNACKAGALALTERPALMAELAAAREQIRERDKYKPLAIDFGQQLETLRGQTDWRSRTCGECGWAHCFKGQNGSELFICRKNAWMSGDQWGLPMPACPAFVDRESATHAASIAAGKE